MPAHLLPLAVLLILSSGASASAAASDRWIELRSDRGTVLISDGSESDATALLMRIDRLRARVDAALGPAIRESSDPLIVIAPRNKAGMTELVGSGQRNKGMLAAASLPGPHAHHLLIDLGSRHSRDDVVLLHEYVHFLTRTNLGDAPAWLDEGLSEFWSTLEEKDGRLQVGRPLSAHLRRLRTKDWLPMADLIKVPRGRYDQAGRDTGLVYAQSWALVHYLLRGMDSAAPQYAPQTPDELTVLDARVRSYINGSLRPLQFAASPPATTTAVRIRQLSIAESQSLRAYAVVFGERPEAALSLATKALAQNSKEPLALEVTGLYYFLSNQPEDARRWLGRAVAAPDASYRAHYYYAVVKADTPSIAEYHLKKALEIKPDFSPARERLPR